MLDHYECERRARLLRCAANLLAVEFQVSDNNKPAELQCRLWTTDPMTKLQLMSLASKLNAAIEPVIAEAVRELQADALKPESEAKP